MAKREEDSKCPLMAFSLAAGGKYKMRILWEWKEGPKRYGELRRSAIVAARGTPGTPRVLSRGLKEMEARRLITRKEYPVVPPKVEYALTKLGKSLVPVIKEIVRWGLTPRHKIVPSLTRPAQHN